MASGRPPPGSFGRRKAISRAESEASQGRLQAAMDLEVAIATKSGPALPAADSSQASQPAEVLSTTARAWDVAPASSPAHALSPPLHQRSRDLHTASVCRPPRSRLPFEPMTLYPQVSWPRIVSQVI